MEKSVVEQLGIEFFNEKYKNTIVVLEGKVYFINQAASSVIKPTAEIIDLAAAMETKQEEWDKVTEELRILYDESGFNSYEDSDDVDDEDMDAWREFRDVAIEIDTRAMTKRRELMTLQHSLDVAKKDLKKEHVITVFNFEENKQEKLNAKAINDWKCFWDFPLGFRTAGGNSFSIEKDTRGHRAYRLHNVDDSNERAGLATKLRWWIEGERWRQITNPTFPTVKDAIEKVNETGGWLPISLKARVQKFQNTPKRFAITVNGANVMLLDEHAKVTNVRSSLYTIHKEDANLPDYENFTS